MNAVKTPKPNSKRIGFSLPESVAGDFELIRKKLGAPSDARLAEMATAFAIRQVKAGELVNVNGELVPAQGGVPVAQAA